jgi:predicted PurR-regulated permease PerM
MGIKEEEYTKVRAVNSHIYIAIGLTALTIVVLLVLWYALNFIFLIFAGVLLAIFLRTLTNLVSQKTHLPNKASFLLTLVLLVSAISILFAFLAPAANKQIGPLSDEFSRAWVKIEQELSSYFNEPLSSLSGEGGLKQWISPNLLLGITNIFSTTFGVISSFLIFLFIGVFLAFDPDIYVSGIMKLIPPQKRPRAKEILEQITNALYGWLMGTFVSMVAVGILTTIGLWVIGLPLALSLGLLAGILTFIPTLGILFAAIPAVVIAFIQSPITALYVILLYCVVHAAESYFITPTIQQRAISLPPVLAVTSQLLMALIVGIPGLIVATPLLATVMVLIQTLYIEDTLGDKT